MTAMTRFFLLIPVSALLLAGCETERTVLSTESRMSFGDQWRGHAGDVDELKEKFAGGFEIRDGRAVVAGEPEKRSRRDKRSRTLNVGGEKMDVPRSAVKKIRPGMLGRILDGNEDDGVERFTGIKGFEGKTFDAVSVDSSGRAAHDSRKSAPWAGRDSNLPSNFAADRVSSSQRPFETHSGRDAGKKFATDASRDSERRFDFRKDRNLDNPTALEQRTARHAEAEVTLDIRQPGVRLTEDEVRSLLHPGS